jgi:ribonuclease HII
MLKELQNAKTTIKRDDLNYSFDENEKIRLEITFSPIHNSYSKLDNNSTNVGYVIIMRDITKAKSLEEERDEFISVISHEVIDRINILQASLLAMKKAIAACSLEPDLVLIDGNQPLPDFPIKQETIVGGDAAVFCIAAASIIAKVSRDFLMLAEDKKYPEYQFAKHKGYGTKLHLSLLEQYGPCPIHRRSFAPVKKLITQKGSKKTFH